MQMTWQRMPNQRKMQGAVDHMSKACDDFQLTISTKKTEVVVHQSAYGKPYSEPTITVNGQKQVGDKFTYLESTLSRAVHIDEITTRIAKASVA